MTSNDLIVVEFCKYEKDMIDKHSDYSIESLLRYYIDSIVWAMTREEFYRAATTYMQFIQEVNKVTSVLPDLISFITARERLTVLHDANEFLKESRR